MRFTRLAACVAPACGLFINAPAAAWAQPATIALQLRPHVGDTLRLRVDQTIEMQRSASGKTGADATEVASIVVLARIAVESTDLSGAVGLIMADSVRVAASDAYETSGVIRAARALQGQRIRFRMSSDGSTHVLGADTWAASAASAFLSQLPATLPAGPVTEGATWTRAVQIPLPVTSDGRGVATLTATFTFDSLSRSAEFAHLSVKGRLVRSGPVPVPPGSKQAAGFVQTAGDVSGRLVIDRRRGWISDARTVVTLRSLLAAAGKDAATTRVSVKITQWMRVF